MALRSAIINVMAMAADKAGKRLIRDFGEVEQLQVSRKGPADFVSSADRKAERDFARSADPGAPRLQLADGGIGRHARQGQPPPLDCRSARRDDQFLARHPAFLYFDCAGTRRRHCRRGDLRPAEGRSVLGPNAAWAPMSTNGACGYRGRTQLPDALFATGIPFLGIQDGAGHARFLNQLGRVMAQCSRCAAARFRRPRPGLCRGGTLRGLLGKNGLNAWDVAAGILLVREAGGQVTDIAGRTYKLGADDICAGNDQLHQPLRKLLHETASVISDK